MSAARLGDHRTFCWLLPAVVVSLLLSGCGGGGNEAKPVDEQLGFDQEGILKRQARAENIVRDCMRGQGFKYVPVDPGAQRAALIGSAGMSEEDFEKQLGYGITTLYDKQRNLPADPNTAIYNALTPADQRVYDDALYGENHGATFAQAVDTGFFGQLGGCTKSATEEVFGGKELLDSLVSLLDELDQRIVTDQRVVEAISNWSDCMRDSGFDSLGSPEQVDVLLLRKLDLIVGPPDARRATYDAAALAALQREEVAMVRSDIECEKKHISKVQDAVQAEYEKTLREEHVDLIKGVPAA